MKKSLLLALWSAGALASPCKPARDVTHKDYDVPTAPSTYFVPTTSAQDTTVETHIASGSDGDETISVPIRSTETFAGGSEGHTVELPQGSATFGSASPLETTVADGDISEASQDSEIPFVSETWTPNVPELTGGSGTTAVPTNRPSQPGQPGDDVTGSETTNVAGDFSTTLPVTNTATDIAGQPSEDATNTELSSNRSGLTDSVGATETDNIPGQSGDDSTKLSATGTETDAIDQPSGDVDNTVAASSNASSLADGVAATETVTHDSVETASPGANTETSVNGVVPTEGAPATAPTDDASSHVTGSAGITGGQPDATGDATDGTADVPATTRNPDFTETGLSGAPDETISPSGTDTETSTSGAGNTSQNIVATTGIAPEQSSEITPGNTNVNEKTTGSVTEDLPRPTDTGVPTEANDVSTSAMTGPETTVDPAEQTPTTTEETQDNGSNETTELGSDKTSAVKATTTEGDQPDETDVATQPASDNSDTTTFEVSSSDSEVPSTAIGVTTTDAAATTDGENDNPSTTALNGNSSSKTLNPAPVTTTTAGDAPFPTVTDAPEGFSSSTVSGHPEWTSNTWITTTSGDSSEPTIIPVLVGCKKCGGSGSGIVLWNFPKTPDTWFKLPGLPKFTFPCIPPGCSTPPTTSESNSNDDDGDDEEDNEPSSTTCTDKATVTDCFVACTTYTGPAGASITPECSTTCTATHTGCSVTGTTTTSSAAACGPSGDSSCVICSNDDLEDTGSNSLDRRDNYLEKRAGRDIRSVGGCAAFAFSPAFPAYPGGETVLYKDATIISQNSPLNDIKRWWLTTQGSQCVPILRGNLDAATFIKDRTDPTGHGVASLDHVYEKSMLLDFFNEIIDPNGPPVKGMSTGGPRHKINCQDMESYGGATKNSKKRLLQKVYDTYPSGTLTVRKGKLTIKDAHYLEDFIGMNHWTNGIAKAFVADTGDVKKKGDEWSDARNDVTASTSKKDAERRIKGKFALLEKMAIGVEMFSAPEAIDSIIRQNQRIYARFTDMDNEAKGCMNDPAVKNGLWSFADKYKTFMQTRFNGQDPWSINNEVDGAKTKVIDKLKMDLVAAVNVRVNNAADWKSKIAEWNLKLASLDDPTRLWAIPEPAWVWTWIKKRDGEDSGLSCDRPIPSDSTTSEESTTFATSTKTSSEESSSEESTSFTEETSSTDEMITSTTEDSVQLTDFPTLTNAPPLSISTPDGSSCASTTTYTQCNLGTGNHGGACVANSQCASWVNTETTSTTPTPTPTMESPDPSQNIKHCYDEGPKVSHDSITVNAESFCNKVVSKNKDNGYYWSNDKLEEKLLPGGGGRGYHYKVLFEVKEGCLWKADFDECMRYMKVPIDSCDCSAKGNKQGGWVENNCITAKIDPNKGD
ncbi:hypothetical protein FPOAC2_07507 [Fusarium poae]